MTNNRLIATGLQPEQHALLSPPLRLAVAYAPAAARPWWTGLLLLDHRLRQAALGVREPLIAQIKLAWWRDRFAEPVERWPHGEPLLAQLRRWEPELAALSGLVDGWEGLVGGEGGVDEIAAIADARGAAMAALARLLGCPGAAGAASQAGQTWALRDLAVLLGQAEARALADQALSPPRLPRALRPLAVLAGARGEDQAGLRGFARMVRLGLLGR